MRRFCKTICCLGAALMMFTVMPRNVQAADSFTCGQWVTVSVTPECRTPMCDGTRLGLYVTYKFEKSCTYDNTGEKFTLHDTRIDDRGCC